MAPEFTKFRWNDHPVRVALKGAAGAVATVMFNRANMDGSKVFVTQESLADDLTISIRTVRRAQKELEALGLIRCVVKGNNLGRAGRPSVYELTMPPKNTGHLFAETTGRHPRTPDIGVQNTGHRCPEHRTPVSALIDPLLDPGNRPGSLEANTVVSAFEASSFADRPEIPLGSAAVRDTTVDTDPFGVGCLGVGDEPRQGSALGGHEMSAQECGTDQPTAEGTQPVTYDPFDAFGPSRATEADFGCWPPARSESSPADQAVHFEHPDLPAQTEVKPAIPDPLGLDACEKWEHTDSGDPRDPFSSAFVHASQRGAG
jgi:hypothetical protein